MIGQKLLGQNHQYLVSRHNPARDKKTSGCLGFTPAEKKLHEPFYLIDAHFLGYNEYYDVGETPKTESENP